jgi:hypothetical protein
LEKNDRINMTNQSKLCAAIQGKKAARIKDNEAGERRQAGWKDWGEHKKSALVRKVQTHELKAIRDF